MTYKYDVFISYSRKDTIVADQITQAFEREGITFFIDRRGITGGMEFPTVLATAIRESKIFLFLASKNSYISKFTQKEIVYAFNKKESQDIIPYIIDGSKLPEQLEFTFSDINWRQIEKHPIDTVLIDDVLFKLGRQREKEEPVEKFVMPPKEDRKTQGHNRIPIGKVFKFSCFSTMKNKLRGICQITTNICYLLIAIVPIVMGGLIALSLGKHSYSPGIDIYAGCLMGMGVDFLLFILCVISYILFRRGKNREKIEQKSMVSPFHKMMNIFWNIVPRPSVLLLFLIPIVLCGIIGFNTFGDDRIDYYGNTTSGMILGAGLEAMFMLLIKIWNLLKK